MSKASIVSKVFILFSSLVLSSFAQSNACGTGMFDDTVWFLDVTPKTSLVESEEGDFGENWYGADAGKFYFVFGMNKNGIIMPNMLKAAFDYGSGSETPVYVGKENKFKTRFSATKWVDYNGSYFGGCDTNMSIQGVNADGVEWAVYGVGLSVLTGTTKESADMIHFDSARISYGGVTEDAIMTMSKMRYKQAGGTP